MASSSASLRWEAFIKSLVVIGAHLQQRWLTHQNGTLEHGNHVGIAMQILSTCMGDAHERLLGERPKKVNRGVQKSP